MTAAPSTRPRETPSSESARGRRERAQQVALDERQDRLRLRIAETAVVLEHARPVGREHEAGEEGADERRATQCELVQHRLDARLEQAGERVAVDARDGRERAHAARVRPLVAVVGPLEVTRGGERQGTRAVADGEDRELRALEQLLDEHRALEVTGRVEAGLELHVRAADEDALARRETVGLDHARRTRHVEQRSRRHARGCHHLLREPLRALDPGRGRRRAEDGDPRVPERVGHTRDEGSLRADDDQVDRERPRKPEQAVTIVRGDRDGRSRAWRSPGSRAPRADP